MERDAERLYDLIWKQFVACQMNPAEYQSTNLIVSASEYELKHEVECSSLMDLPRVLPPMAKKGNEDQNLPDVQEGEMLSLKELFPSQLFTKPTARFTEASLVKELEKKGIGRPSTYASIISTIQDRGYARVVNKRFYAEKMGDIVTDRLEESFVELMDYGFTAEMESTLDQIASGELNEKMFLITSIKTFKAN